MCVAAIIIAAEHFVEMDSERIASDGHIRPVYDDARQMFQDAIGRQRGTDGAPDMLAEHCVNGRGE